MKPTAENLGDISTFLTTSFETSAKYEKMSLTFLQLILKRTQAFLDLAMHFLQLILKLDLLWEDEIKAGELEILVPVRKSKYRMPRFLARVNSSR